MPRLEINGHLVDFDQMPSEADIDEVAQGLPSTSTTSVATTSEPTSLSAAAYRRGITQPLEQMQAGASAVGRLGKAFVTGQLPPQDRKSVV